MLHSAGQPGRLSTGPALDLIERGHSQDFTALQAVNVITNESVWIEVLDCQHDLLHGNAIVRTHLGSDGPESVRSTCGPEGIGLISGAERALGLLLTTH